MIEKNESWIYAYNVFHIGHSVFLRKLLYNHIT
jgi:hypothetical protein